MKRAVIYVRVSTRDQAEGGYSLEAQIEACRRFVSQQGWSLVGEYVDAGDSAKTTDRPHFQQMLSDLADDRSISFVVVHKVDRFARNLEDHVVIRARFKKWGVRLVSATEGFEDTPAGRMVEGIVASIAGWYSENLGLETRKGMEQKARNGIWPSIAPIGYLNVRADGLRKAESVLAIDPERASLITQAFELYASGRWNLTALHAEMTKRGLRTRRGRAVSRSILAAALKNKVYAGIVSWGEIEVAGKHPPLVSGAVFDQVQRVFSSHDKAAPRLRKHLHHLRGSLVCASCGSKVSSTTAKNGRFPYFFCIGRMQRRTDCREPYVPIERIERQVESLYAGIQLSVEGRERVRATLEAQITKRAIGGERNAIHQAKRLAKIQAQREMALQAHYKGAISVELLKSELDRFDEEEAELRRLLTSDRSALEKARDAAEAAMNLLDTCRDSYLKAKEYAGETCERIRSHWTQALFKAIYLGDGEIKGFAYREPLPELLALASSNSVRCGSAISASGRAARSGRSDAQVANAGSRIVRHLPTAPWAA